MVNSLSVYSMGRSTSLVLGCIISCFCKWKVKIQPKLNSHGQCFFVVKLYCTGNGQKSQIMVVPPIRTTQYY